MNLIVLEKGEVVEEKNHTMSEMAWDVSSLQRLCYGCHKFNSEYMML